MSEDIDVIDKQAITEIIYRYCRGLDRMDRELTLSCWHEGGTDDHGALFSGTADEFVAWEDYASCEPRRAVSV